MILNLRHDCDNIDYIINEVQEHGTTNIMIGQLGLLKRCLYSLELTDTLIRLCSKSVKSMPDTELATSLAEELNLFIRKSEELDASPL